MSQSVTAVEILDHLLLITIGLDGAHAVLARGKAAHGYDPAAHRVHVLHHYTLPDERPALIVGRECPDNPYLLRQRPGFRIAQLTPPALLAALAEEIAVQARYAARRGRLLPLALDVPVIADLAAPHRPQLRLCRAVAIAESLPKAA